jgi:hypothetical protein
MRRRSSLVIGALALCAGLACSSVPPLANASGSPESLAASVLEALARSDRARLDAIALSEQEFRNHVWPGLPAARPERNLPFSYVWKDLHQKSTISLLRTMEDQGGKRYTLKRVTFSGKTNYAGYIVHRDARFEVTDAAGTSTSLQVCGSFLEKDGVWKVFSYVVD